MRALRVAPGTGYLFSPGKVVCLLVLGAAGQVCPTAPATGSEGSKLLHLLQKSTGHSQRTDLVTEHGLAWTDHPAHAACLGYGANHDKHTCLATSPSGPAGGVWQSSSTCQTISVRVPRPLGCSIRPCWMQLIRVAVDGANTIESGMRAGVYTTSGNLLAVTHVVQIFPGSGSDTWIDIQLHGSKLELHATDAGGDLWLALQFQHRVKIVYDAVPEAEAAKVANEAWDSGLASVRHWADESSRRVWSGTFRAPRVQLFVGDVSSLPGVIPLVIEAPHGGRIATGWPTRSTGSQVQDFNTDLFAEMMWAEVARRCGGRHPRAVIMRVDRQGVDASRAIGNATHTTAGTPCHAESSGQCCCDIADHSAQQVAEATAAAYHAEVLSAVQEAGSGSFVVSVHATGRGRVELGMGLSRHRLNIAAVREPPSFDSSDWRRSTLRPLGPAAEQAELIWGTTGLGARLVETNPGLEIIPSPGLLCPDPETCPGSSNSHFFSGGHILKLVTSDTQSGAQIELPPSLRERDSGDIPLSTAVRRVTAGVVAFLNQHWPNLGGSCHADVNFGIDCGGHGQPHLGGCNCDPGYVGETCGTCDEGYVQQPDKTCSSVGFLGVPAEELDSEKHAWASRRSSSGRQYMYWRRSALPSLDCGAQGCPIISLRAKIRCDSQALSSVQSARASTDWWLDVPLSCPTLTTVRQSSQHIYMAFWFTKKLRLRWESEQPHSERAHACSYNEDSYESNPSSQSADACVDTVPPAELPSWREQACEDLPTYKCKSWTSSGVRTYYGPMLRLLYSKA